MEVMDTVAGARIFRSRFQLAFRPDQAVMHGDRRATFIRMNVGGAVIRHWGDSRAIAGASRRPLPPARETPLPR
jgi:hypothetical protein